MISVIGPYVSPNMAVASVVGWLGEKSLIFVSAYFQLNHPTETFAGAPEKIIGHRGEGKCKLVIGANESAFSKKLYSRVFICMFIINNFIFFTLKKSIFQPESFKMNSTIAAALTFLRDVSCMICEPDSLPDATISALRSFLLIVGMPTRKTEQRDKIRVFRFCAFISIRAMMELGELRNYIHNPSPSEAGKLWGALISGYRLSPDIMATNTERYRVQESLVGTCIVELGNSVPANSGTYVSDRRGTDVRARQTDINQYYFYSNQVAVNLHLPVGIIIAKVKVDQITSMIRLSFPNNDPLADGKTHAEQYLPGMSSIDNRLIMPGVWNNFVSGQALTLRSDENTGAWFRVTFCNAYGCINRLGSALGSTSAQYDLQFGITQIQHTGTDLLDYKLFF